ncbi:MAG: hypothetical protein PHW18_08895 [Sulfuricurvum sp.]|uniref:XAC2610-related protein n=1 Tax=Sulfuricurvum sp. TaxID=2025608 RepID=UPI002636A4B3|nr:hypothetical protein [Sulfuricurvum sp.]MDD2829675.1 hypothetical protein [Sulfuricurvum sp.]MDD4948658.1 hypothetical protein [Sulfuricurvum sp.]
MYRYFFIIVSIFIYFTSMQASQIVESTDIGGKVGIVRAELMEIEKNEYVTYAEIRLFHDQATIPFQRIAVDVEIERPYFEFVDLNGDTYKDLVFYRTCGAGYQCVGPFPFAGDVYIFNPDRERFEALSALSERGEVQSAKRKGCATVYYKSGLSGYTTETWCIDKRSCSGWKLKSLDGGE